MYCALGVIELEHITGISEELVFCVEVRIIG